MTIYSTTIDYRDTNIEYSYGYEPSGVGGDYDEILPASVEIESLKVGDTDVFGLVEDQIEKIELVVLRLHEAGLEEARADAEIDTYLNSQEYVAHG